MKSVMRLDSGLWLAAVINVIEITPSEINPDLIEYLWWVANLDIKSHPCGLIQPIMAERAPE